MSKLFIVICLIYSVRSSDLGNECDVDNLIDLETNLTVKRDEFCKNVTCLFRYCHLPNTILVHFKDKTKQCKTLEEIKLITNMTIPWPNNVYRAQGEDTPQLVQNKSLENLRHVSYVDRNVYESKNCTQNWLHEMKDRQLYILENGSMVQQKPNTPPRHLMIPKGRYIVEFVLHQNPRTGVWAKRPRMSAKFLMERAPEISYGIYIYNGIGMAVSCAFLLLVLVVYSMFRKLQTLPGLMLMAYVTSLMVGLGVKALQTLLQMKRMHSSRLCLVMSTTWYYGIIASFFWMNIMSFDIFWIFCTSYTARIPNKREMRKFLTYCLYGFGVPLLILVVALTIDFVELPATVKIMKPLFKQCFTKDTNTMYLYVPIIFVLVCNLIFFVLTSIKIFIEHNRLSRFMKTADSKNTNKNKSRFFTYLKLTFVTGMNWLLDLVEVYFTIPTWLTYVLDTNVFIGIAIFVIFVCKRDVFVLLCRRFSIRNRFTERWGSSVASHTDSRRRKKSSSASLHPSSPITETTEPFPFVNREKP